MTDLRHAARVLRHRPTTTAIIILTLALCIGANTAIFSIVDATLLRPLPYPAPDRLVRIVRHYKGQGGEADEVGQSGRVWEAIRDHATFLDAAPFKDNANGVNLSSNGSARYVKQQRVGAGFFRVLGVAPLVGREFTAAEDRPGGPAVTVLSYSAWRSLFQGDPAVAGKTINLRGEPYTVVGVMPADFRTGPPADLWTPLRPTSTGEGSGWNYAIAARLKPGVTWAQADSQLEAAGAPLIQAMKVSPDVHMRLSIVSLQQGQTQELRKPLFILWGAVGLVLLIGCANVASLLLARAASRRREIATRMALGGGRRAIIRQLLVESLLLAALGGAAGVAVGYGALEGLKSLGATSFPAVNRAHLDARVLAATGLLCLLVSLLAGIFPAIEGGGVDLRNALSEAGARGVAGSRKRWSRRLLVAGEVAIAMLLLIGAGLMVRTLSQLYSLRPGFEPAHLITASFSLDDARYRTSQSVNQLFASGLERIHAIPGVESAGAGLSLPYEQALNVPFWRSDGPESGSRVLLTNSIYATPGYLETLRIPLLRGRLIRDSDGPKSAAVAVVNDAFVQKYLSRQDPLGSHVRFSPDPNSSAAEIVGVVGSVQQKAGWGDFGPSGTVPTMYVPALQTGDGAMRMVHGWFPPSWVVRVAGDPAAAIRGIQDSMTAIDPLLPLAKFRTVDDIRAQSFSAERFQTTLLAAMSGLALILAIVGVYGLMSQSVVERRRELGIRLALGASVSQAIRQATLPGLALGAVGVAAGCLLALLSTKIMAHLVWNVSTTDPITYAIVSIGLLAVAGAASLIPAMRITKLNPADTLRDE